MVPDRYSLIGPWAPRAATELEARVQLRDLLTIRQTRAERIDVLWMEELFPGTPLPVLRMTPEEVDLYSWWMRYQATEVMGMFEAIKQKLSGIGRTMLRLLTLKAYKEGTYESDDEESEPIRSSSQSDMGPSGPEYPSSPAECATGSVPPFLGTQPPAAVGSPDPIPLVSPTTGFWDPPVPPDSAMEETRPKTLDFDYHPAPPPSTADDRRPKPSGFDQQPAPPVKKEPERSQRARQPLPAVPATRRSRQSRRDPPGTIFGRYLWGFQPPVPASRQFNGRPSRLPPMVPSWTQLEDDRVAILTQFGRFLKSYAGPMDPFSSESIRRDFLLAVLYAQFPVIADHPALCAYEVPPEGTQTVAKLGQTALAPSWSAQASWYDQQLYLLTRANPDFKVDETPSTLLDVFHEGKTPTGIFQSTLLCAKLYFQAYTAGLNHPADAPRRYVTPVMDTSAGDRARAAAAKAKAASRQSATPATSGQSAPSSPKPTVVKGRGRGRGYGRQVSTSALPGGVKVAFTEASADRPGTSTQPSPRVTPPPVKVPTAMEVLQTQLEQRAQAIADVHRRDEVEQQLVLRTESALPEGSFGARLRTRTASPSPLSSLWERLSQRSLELPGATSTTYQINLPDGTLQQAEQLRFNQTYQLNTSELILDEYILTRRRSFIPTLRELSPLHVEHPAIDMYRMSPRALGTHSPVDNPFRVDRHIQLGEARRWN